MRRLFSAWVVFLGVAPCALAEFRVEPYLQLVERDSIAIVWWSQDEVPGTLD